MDQITPILLAGGVGRRLWPLSTSARPKQFLNLFRGESLFAQSLARVSGLAQPIVVCASAHTHYVCDCDVRVVSEDQPRNTAPAMMAALELLDDDDLCLVMPCDHVIAPVEALLADVQRGVRLAQDDRIVTFGIKPTYPHTGYGYIQCGKNGEINQFTEKPDLKTAKKYIKSTDFVWNSGIFLFKKRVMVGEMAKYCADWRKNGAISIDFAVMERTSRASVVLATFGWSDVGSWLALLRALVWGATTKA